MGISSVEGKQTFLLLLLLLFLSFFFFFLITELVTREAFMRLSGCQTRCEKDGKRRGGLCTCCQNLQLRGGGVGGVVTGAEGEGGGQDKVSGGYGSTLHPRPPIPIGRPYPPPPPPLTLSSQHSATGTRLTAVLGPPGKGDVCGRFARHEPREPPSLKTHYEIAAGNVLQGLFPGGSLTAVHCCHYFTL